MARSKIDYGIDLGTTNSAISRMESGESIIIKTDLRADTMPSCVYINKKKSILVGETAFNKMDSDKKSAMRIFDSKVSNSFSEFKRTMGTDKKYFSSVLEREFSSEELSAEVLKALKSFVSDESFQSVVVTVPAKFTINQKDATLRAAKLAGFNHCELLQEPIAASMAYGIDSQSKDGYWLVFDFGGGTFDAALLKVEEGIMKVIDTEGDNYLGGKNLDYAIIDEIIIPNLQENNSISSIIEDEGKKSILQNAVKGYAETTKIQMSFRDTHNIIPDLGELPGEDDEGEEFEIDIDVTQEMMKTTLGPIFQKAIDICQSLLNRNNLTGNKLDSLILVGGPTYSPILRKMLEEQITKPDVSVDPMTVVSKGAALFASTVNISDEIKEQERDNTKIQLDFGYEATTVEEEELVTVKFLKNKTEGDIPDKFFVDIVRNDKSWSSGKTEIDENGDVIEVKLNLGKPNSFNVFAYNEKGDSLSSEPSEFTIIQGSKIGSATLPYNIGIMTKSRTTGKVGFTGIKGLEKNQSTPATGTINGLKTQNQIRPGSTEDSIKIGIYEGEHNAEGTPPINNEQIYDVVITGEELPKLLPKDSDVDLTLKVESEQIKLSAFFPFLDFTHDVEVPTDTTQSSIDPNWLENEIDKAQQSIELLQGEDLELDNNEIEGLESEVEDIKKKFVQDRGDEDRKKQTLNNLRKSLNKLETIQAASEWPKTEEELKDVFYRLEKINAKLGDDESTEHVENFKEQIPEVIKEKNVKVAQGLIDNMRSLDFKLMDEGLGANMEIGYLKNFNDEFDTLDWKDENRARMTLDRGLQLAADNPTKEKLRPIVVELFDLLPEADKPIIGSGDGRELVR